MATSNIVEGNETKCGLMSYIVEGTRVILQKTDEYKSCIVQKDSFLKMGKMKFSLNGLIGKSFGSLFQIEDEKLIPAVVQTEVLSTDGQGCISDKSNKNLCESDANQKMKQEDIFKMKESGKTGEEIVEKLVENSQTFQTKTEFSQEKYIKKKKEKHVALVRVLKPTTRLVLEMFYRKCPADIGYMRVDTYSQILAFVNIVPWSNIGVIDTYKGLLVAAVLEQLGGTGSIIQFIPDNIFLKDCLKYYNLSNESLDSHYHYNIENLGTLEADSKKDDATESCNMATTCVKVEVMETESPCDLAIDNNQSANTNATSKPDTSINNRKRKRDERPNKTPEELEAEKQNRLQNAAKRKKAQNILLNGHLDGLIIASKFYPTPLVMRILDFMKPSRPVVIYSQTQEPLTDCYMKLKGSGKGVNLQLTETWYREYQVLPQRTHPVVRMSGSGGYLLTFTTVNNIV